MFEDAPWDVTFDQRFLSTVEELDRSSGELKDNITKTVNAIVENPLKGDPKTGQLRGYRTTHIEHLVIVWELDPEIISMDHMDKLEEVYFHNVKHHDKMRDAVGTKKPLDISQHFTVTFETYDVQDTIAQLYDTDTIDVEDQQWNEDGVTVTGALDGDSNTLTELLPESATIELTKPTLP